MSVLGEKKVICASPAPCRTFPAGLIRSSPFCSETPLGLFRDADKAIPCLESISPLQWERAAHQKSLSPPPHTSAVLSLQDEPQSQDVLPIPVPPQPWTCSLTQCWAGGTCTAGGAVSDPSWMVTKQAYLATVEGLWEHDLPCQCTCCLAQEFVFALAPDAVAARDKGAPDAATFPFLSLCSTS